MIHGVWLVPVVFVLLLCSSGIGMALRGRLHDKHRASDTVDHVRLVVSIVVTLTALVLGLVLTNVKGSFDTFDGRVRTFAGDLSNLDTHLREYGDEAKPIRATLREYVAAVIADSWRDEPPPSGAYPRFKSPAGVERRELGPSWSRWTRPSIGSIRRTASISGSPNRCRLGWTRRSARGGVSSRRRTTPSHGP